MHDIPLKDSVALPLIRRGLGLTPFTLMTEHVDFSNFPWWPRSRGGYCGLPSESVELSEYSINTCSAAYVGQNRQSQPVPAPFHLA